MAKRPIAGPLSDLGADEWETVNASLSPSPQPSLESPPPKRLKSVATAPTGAPSGGTLTKAEAKASYVLTDSELKKLSSETINGRTHYPAAEVHAAAMKKHGGEKGLQRAKCSAALFSKKVDGKTLEQHRRALGDECKANIHVEKWCIAARCHCVTTCHPDVWRALVVPNADSVTPAGEFSEVSTPVIVASVSRNASLIFGATKLTGGTRMGSWHADKMELVYLPPTRELRIWWTMR